MTTPTRYPVIEEHPLPPVPRRLLGARRRPEEMPTPRPGTVLVFQVGTRWDPFLEGRHVRGTEESVVNAVSVSLVDIRDREVPVDLRVASVHVSHDFLVRSWFRCRVTRPEVVAAAGLIDVTPVLAAQLGQDRDLAAIGRRHDIAAVNELRGLAVARVTAYCTVRPPEVDGMNVELASVEVLTPTDVRGHALQMRAEEWDQALETLRRVGKQENVDWLERLLGRGTAAKEAYALSAGAMDAAVVAERAYEAEQQRQADLLKLVEVLADAKQLDRVPIDAAHLVDALSERLTGAPPPDREALQMRHSNGAPKSIEGSNGDDAPTYEDMGDDFVD